MTALNIDVWVRVRAASAFLVSPEQSLMSVLHARFVGASTWRRMCCELPVRCIERITDGFLAVSNDSLLDSTRASRI